MNKTDFIIKITNKCDKGCPYCCEKSCINGKMMDFNLFREILSKVSKYTKYIGITGGEALLYKNQGKDFTDIISSLREYNLSETIMTGGVYDNNYYRNILRCLTNVNFYLSVSPINRNWYKRLVVTLDFFKRWNYKLGGVNLIERPNWESKKKNYCIKTIKNTIASYGFSVPVIHTIPCLPIGKGKQFLDKEKVKVEIRGCRIYPSHIIFIKENGLLYPCCATFESKKFYKMGWKKYYIKDIDEAIEESNKFCNNCKYRS